MSPTLPSSQPPVPADGGQLTTAAVHYYRAELARMTSWRDRLDRTTNWAITVVAALLSVSLSTPTAQHGVLLFAMLLVTLLLYVEARRYRFYDVYRMRVRQFERHYFAPMFSAHPLANGDGAPWMDVLAEDLRHPRFRIGLLTALKRRLRRNYAWLYWILLLAWAAKLSLVATGGEPSVPALLAVARIGPAPGWIVIVLVAALYAAVGLGLIGKARPADEDEVRM